MRIISLDRIEFLRALEYEKNARVAESYHLDVIALAAMTISLRGRAGRCSSIAHFSRHACHFMSVDLNILAVHATGLIGICA